MSLVDLLLRLKRGSASASFQPPHISLRLPDTSNTNGNANGDDPMNGGQARAGPSRRPRYDTSVIPDEYEVHVPADRAKNTYIFSENVRTWGPMSRASGEGSQKKKQKGECDRASATAFCHHFELILAFSAHPKLVARVAHECTAKPVKNPKYLKILQQRQQDAQSSRRWVIRLLPSTFPRLTAF